MRLMSKSSLMTEASMSWVISALIFSSVILYVVVLPLVGGVLLMVYQSFPKPLAKMRSSKLASQWRSSCLKASGLMTEGSCPAWSSSLTP